MPHLQCAVLWNGLEKPRTEYCGLWRLGTGWELAGTIITTYDDRILPVRYHIICDLSWHTRVVGIKMSIGNVEHSLQLTVDDQQRWWEGSNELVALQGCMDISLDVTPATNTFPIRRMGLDVTRSCEIRVAYISLPDLTVVPTLQLYTRLNENCYLYKRNGNLLADKVEVDEFGLVVYYSDSWERVSFVNCLIASQDNLPTVELDFKL